MGVPTFGTSVLVPTSGTSQAVPTLTPYEAPVYEPIEEAPIAGEATPKVAPVSAVYHPADSASEQGALGAR